MLTAIASLLAACGKFYSKLSPSHPRINQNMKDYYEVKSISSAQGQDFEAKLLQCVKLKSHNTTYYHYRVVVAPRTEMPLQSFNVFFLPPQGLAQYFLIDHPFASNEMMKGSVPDLSPYSAMDTVEKLWPIEFRFTWTNYGDEIQRAADITNDAFDEQMRTLRVEVHFNGKIELMQLSMDLPFLEIASINDPQVEDNAFLQAIFKENLTFSQRKPYRTTEL
jgi:hypothetical protein